MCRERLDLSIIIPVFNEEENLPILYQEIKEALAPLQKSYEIIFIDDGSQDNSFAVLKKIQALDEGVKIIRLRRNFGQTAALSAGFDYARGKIIITMDADLQNDPHDIPLLLAKIEEGYDMVNGWRQKRQDKFLTRRLPSMIANRLISLLTGIRLHDYGCTLKAVKQDVIKNIRLYGELHRFIPAVVSALGASIAEVQVSHRSRLFGRSKYNLFRLPRVILDMLTVKFLLSYSTRPLQIFGLIGLVSGAIGFFIALWLSYQRLILKISSANRPILLLAVLLMVIGVQFITLGLMAEIMVRTYHESTGKAIYHIREVIDRNRSEESCES